MIASLDHKLPVGLEGELIIIPFIFLEILDLKSFKSGSKFFFESVSTKTANASERVTNSGNDTQYGLKIKTSSPS